MKKFLALLLALCMVVALGGAALAADEPDIKIGLICVHDETIGYDQAHIEGFKAAAEALGLTEDNYIIKTNIPEGPECYDNCVDLAEAGCTLIITDSFGHATYAQQAAIEYPDVEFISMTGANALASGLANLHNMFPHTYESRFVSGVVAGMKLQELIDAGKITADQALIGYVAAYPYAEVISGYTAFLMGARSIVPTATMEVQYANTWGDYDTEKTMATAMIEDGCVIISQHSDTEGPAQACEDAMKNGTEVYCVCYNQDMTDVAPSTCLISSRQDYAPYEIASVRAVMDGKGDTIAVDEGAGFEGGWVAMTPLNTAIAAEGTQEKIDEAIAAFTSGALKATDVFKGPYTAVNPFDESDTIDLTDGFDENATQSAPAYGYVITELITVKGN